MKKSKRVSKQRPDAGRARAYRAGLFACALLVAGVATAAATYASRNAAPPKAAAVQTDDPYVTVEVGGRKLRVNAQTLQQGPLTQEQSRQLAEQLEGNKETDGLVQEKRADGTVSAACVDTPEAAGAFLTSPEKTTATTGTGGNTGAGVIGTEASSQ